MARLEEGHIWSLHLLRQQIFFDLPGSIRLCAGNGVQRRGLSRNGPRPRGEDRHDSNSYEWKEMTNSFKLYPPKQRPLRKHETGS